MANTFDQKYPDLYESLRARYSEPHRHYHTWDHVETLLRHYRKYEWNHPHAVEMAIYYHDAIYDPSSRTNEADSAELMLTEMMGRTEVRTLMRAGSIVLATAGHQIPEEADEGLASDCALFLDMDLAILGAQPREFETYDKAIREEFAHLPDEIFLPRRREVMEDFLHRRYLYLTEEFHRAYDGQARANLRRLVARLHG